MGVAGKYCKGKGGCGKFLPYSDYAKRPLCADGYNTICTSCYNEGRRKKRLKGKASYLRGATNDVRKYNLRSPGEFYTIVHNPVQ